MTNTLIVTPEKVGVGMIIPNRIVNFGNKDTINKKAFKKFKSAM
jgi:hypothetical protein